MGILAFQNNPAENAKTCSKSLQASIHQMVFEQSYSLCDA